MFRFVFLAASIISLIDGGLAEDGPQDLDNTRSVSDSLIRLRAEISKLRRTQKQMNQ